MHSSDRLEAKKLDKRVTLLPVSFPNYCCNFSHPEKKKERKSDQYSVPKTLLCLSCSRFVFRQRQKVTLRVQLQNIPL